VDVAVHVVVRDFAVKGAADRVRETAEMEHVGGREAQHGVGFVEPSAVAGLLRQGVGGARGGRRVGRGGGVGHGSFRDFTKRWRAFVVRRAWREDGGRASGKYKSGGSSLRRDHRPPAGGTPDAALLTYRNRSQKPDVSGVSHSMRCHGLSGLVV